MYASAVALYKDWIERTDGNAGLVSHLGHAYAAAGHTDDALRVLGELEQQARNSPVPPDYLALIHTGLGNVDEAIEHLKQALQQRSWNLAYLRAEPAYERLRPDPRFSSLLDRMRLPE